MNRPDVIAKDKKSLQKMTKLELFHGSSLKNLVEHGGIEPPTS